METILPILIPILGVIFALIGSKDNDKGANNRKQQPVPQQTTRRQSQPPQQRIDNPPVTREPMTMASQQPDMQHEMSSAPVEGLGSAEEEYNQQLEMLRRDLTSSSIELDGKEQKIVSVKKKSEEQGNRPLSIKHSLTKGGIREAIIMSEVLASPKSLSNHRKNI